MSTTDLTAAIPAPRKAEPCPVHRVTHRAGSKTAIECDAERAQTPPAPVLAVVTAEHVTDAMSTWAGRISYLTVGADVIVMAGAFGFGATLVDRADLISMVNHLGSPEAAAELLTQDLQWEQVHAA